MQKMADMSKPPKKKLKFRAIDSPKKKGTSLTSEKLRKRIVSFGSEAVSIARISAIVVAASGVETGKKKGIQR